MKIVNAYVKTHKRSAVVEALHQIPGLTGVTVLHAHGFGRTRAAAEGERSDELGLLAAHDKVEVLCRDALADDVISAIDRAAHTGLRGDGKIYACDVEEAVRIATGERGEDAA